MMGEKPGALTDSSKIKWHTIGLESRTTLRQKTANAYRKGCKGRKTWQGEIIAMDS